jgi:hypothetical protein
MADLIEINTYSPEMMYISKADTYGGKKFDISFSQEMIEMFKWYKEYRGQMLKESQAREQFQSVAAAYEQYQTVLKLVLDQV